MFSEYAPFSWVAAGFAGLVIYTLCVFLYGSGQIRVVRSKYDAKFMSETGGVDPLALVFEGKRIFLNDFVLPSNPNVIGKTFVNCEIVGPANIFLEANNSINNIVPGMIDAVCLEPGKPFRNGFAFRNCAFRGCTFHRVTLFFTLYEADENRNLDWLNWITVVPKLQLTDDPKPSQIEDQTDPEPSESEEEKPQ